MQTLGRPPPVAPPLYAIKGVITAMQRPNLSASHGGALQLGQQAARARRLAERREGGGGEGEEIPQNRLLHFWATKGFVELTRYTNS